MTCNNLLRASNRQKGSYFAFNSENAVNVRSAWMWWCCACGVVRFRPRNHQLWVFWSTWSCHLLSYLLQMPFDMKARLCDQNIIWYYVKMLVWHVKKYTNNNVAVVSINQQYRTSCYVTRLAANWHNSSTYVLFTIKFALSSLCRL